jgi:hypothetical protein
MAEPSFLTPTDPVGFCQSIKTAFPGVANLRVPSNFSIAFAGLAQLSGEAIRSRIKRHLREKSDRDDDDKTKLVKVSDACDCVDRTFRDPDALRQIGEQIISIIIAIGQNILPFPQDDELGELANRMVRCIEEHALRQDTPRAAHRISHHGRPARGHGHGRLENLRPKPPRPPPPPGHLPQLINRGKKRNGTKAKTKSGAPEGAKVSPSKRAR